MFENIYFLNPNFLWMFMLLPGLIFWEFYSHKNKQAYLQLSNLGALKRKTLRVIFRPILFILRIKSKGF